MLGSVLSHCLWREGRCLSSPAHPPPFQQVCVDVFCFYSDLWQYKSLRAFSSSMRVLFWFSNTATRFSRHFTYSFFFRRHSLAASLRRRSKVNIFSQRFLQTPKAPFGHVPVFHQPHLPFARHFLRATPRPQRWRRCHDDPRSEGTGRGGTNLISLNVAGSS